MEKKMKNGFNINEFGSHNFSNLESVFNLRSIFEKKN